MKGLIVMLFFLNKRSKG